MLMLPLLPDERAYMACCGKTICSGCRYCLHRQYCPFCNTATFQDEEEYNKGLLERAEKNNDPMAMHQIGCFYAKGISGFPVDYEKANELFQRASEFGHAGAHCNLASAYVHGKGVVTDRKKAMYHFKLAAIMGDELSRSILGRMEEQDGNYVCAMRHFMIAAKCGHDDSLQDVKRGFMKGLVTKEDFEKTLREHQASQDETKSDQRDRVRNIR